MRIQGFAVMILTTLLAACASNGKSTDGGFDAGQQDADAGNEQGDTSLVTQMTLEVPSGTSLCTTFCEFRTWQEELNMLGQIDLRPGSYIVERKQGFYPAALVESVRFGPQGTLLQSSTGIGEFEALAEHEGEIWIFNYREDFLYGDLPYHLDLKVHVMAEPSGWPEQLVLDDVVLTDNLTCQALIGPGEQIDEVQTFSACELKESARKLLMTGSSENGDEVEVELRWCTGEFAWWEFNNCWCEGQTFCRFLTRLRWRNDGSDVIVDDPDRLIYSAGHHNWFEKFLMIPQTPVGYVTALLLLAPYSDDTGQTNDGWLVELDANWNEISRSRIVQWEESR